MIVHATIQIERPVWVRTGPEDYERTDDTTEHHVLAQGHVSLHPGDSSQDVVEVTSIRIDGVMQTTADLSEEELQEVKDALIDIAERRSGRVEPELGEAGA